MYNVTRNNRDRRKSCTFDYGRYDQEQFRGRFLVTKAGFRGLLDLDRPEIPGHNDRGKRIPIDLQLLFTLRFYDTGTFHMVYRDLCDISQASARRIIKRLSEAIAHLKINYITFPECDMMDQLKLDF